MSFICHAAGVFHRHARPFFLYPPMPYSHASDHSVPDGLTNIVLLIGKLNYEAHVFLSA